ncbi:hypothetical protein [Vibrio anguillarum]|uniref:hypothetical protein n=3 Tax=Vibrio anguillarum TaxID=55601 RepID=UPI000BB46D3C|nr:hypothetical protein [Vibrio anguillarum]ATC60091.1 hypothetical protein CMV05_22035 [Vibrio anguillarum]MBF4341252.1 hypothetical protein [Vibrio anguillarum]
MAILGFFKAVLNPSWRATFGGQAITPWADVRSIFNSDEKALRGISPERFAHHIISNNISQNDQEIIIKRHYRRAVVAGLLLVIALCIGVSAGVFFLTGFTTSYAPIVISLTCSVQFICIVIDNLHKTKQVLVGCCFSRRLLVTNWRNISDLAGGIYINNKCVYKAMPLIGSTLELLKQLEEQSSRKKEHTNER